MRPYLSHLGYFAEAFDTPDILFKEAHENLDDIDFDTMVGMGLSGSLVVPLLAREFGVNFAIIRKKGESTHDDGQFVGNIGHKWIFVDDFIEQGNTLRTVTKAVRDIEQDFYQMYTNDSQVKCVGAYLYGTPHGATFLPNRTLLTKYAL